MGYKLAAFSDDLMLFHPRSPEEHLELQRDALADVANLRAILDSAVAEQGPSGAQPR
ncbi:MAG: hypothetical protein QOF00_1181 [Pseudonocardiales bacterium]|nr:hypothetical protein [Pseudonocardiales bacterium]